MYRKEETLLYYGSNINTLNFVLLCVFPIALFFVLFFKCKVLKKNEFDDECWNIDDSKALQVFAALGVLVHHLTGAATKYGEIYKGPVTVMSYMGILFTSIFFFFSGFGLIRSYEIKENYLDGFVRKKLMAVFVPFVVANLIYVIIGLAEGRIVDAFSFFTSVFGITLINTNAWFIVEILILYIAFYFSYKYIKDDRNKLLAVSLVAALMTLTGFLLKHDYTNINGHWFRGEWWFNTTMIFVFGLIIGKNRDRVVEIFRKHYSKLMIVVIVLLTITGAVEAYARVHLSYYAETYTYYGYPEKLGTYVAQTLLCIVFIVFVLLLSMKVKFGNKILKFLAPYTLEIYLIQDICMINYGYDEQAPDWLLFGGAILLTIVAAVLLHLLLKLVKENITSFIEKRYKDPELSYEIKTEYKKDRTITICFIAFYAVMIIGLIVSGISTAKISYDENKIINEQLYAIKDSAIHSEVKYGFYDTNYYEEGNEDLVWYVIKKDDGRALLLLKESLYPMAYYKKHEAIAYADSDVRDILINEGLYEVFSKSARKHILTDETTGDKVFLLSTDEVNELKIPEEILMSKPTKNAKEYTGIYIDSNNENTSWWLRNDEPSVYASVVNSKGVVREDSEEVNRPRFAVRPAIWVDLNK